MTAGMTHVSTPLSGATTLTGGRRRHPRHAAGPCPQQALDKAQQLIAVGCGQAVQLRLDRLAAGADPPAGNSLAAKADAERDLTPARGTGPADQPELLQTVDEAYRA